MGVDGGKRAANLGGGKRETRPIDIEKAGAGCKCLLGAIERYVGDHTQLIAIVQ